MTDAHQDYPKERVIADITGLVLELSDTGLPVSMDTVCNFSQRSQYTLTVTAYKDDADIGTGEPIFRGRASMFPETTEAEASSKLLALYNELKVFADLRKAQ